MLFTISSQDHSYHRFILRKLAKDKYWRQNGVHFMYISEDVQRGFSPEVEKYGLLCKNGEPALKVGIHAQIVHFVTLTVLSPLRKVCILVPLLVIL